MNQDANEICENFELLKCVECVTALYSRFGSYGKIYMIDIRKVCHPDRPYIVKVNDSGPAISRNGKHYAYEVDGKVYGSVFKSGVSLSIWTSSFEFFNPQTGLPCFVTDNLVSELSFKNFIEYSAGRK